MYVTKTLNERLNESRVCHKERLHDPRVTSSRDQRMHDPKKCYEKCEITKNMSQRHRMKDCMIQKNLIKNKKHGMKS